MRRIGMVAWTRRLPITPWRHLEIGLIPEDAQRIPTTA
jgi:hypothetical protein